MKPSSHRAYYELERERALERCSGCGTCLRACPFLDSSKPGGDDVRALQKRRLRLLAEGEPSDAAYDLAFRCVQCGLCARFCPEGLTPYLMNVIGRPLLLERGARPPGALATFLPQWRYSAPRLLSAIMVKQEQERWMRELPSSPEPSELLFFLGCNVFIMPNLVFTTLDILESMGFSPPVLAGPELCCGGPFLYTGDMEAADRYSRELMGALSAFNPRKVIFWCNTCYFRFQRVFPHIWDVPFETEHISQFLYAHRDRLAFKKRLPLKVTFQDPCFLKQAGVFEEPRGLLSSIPGLRLLEMENTREEALCCGGLGFLSSPEQTLRLKRRRLSQAKRAGARVIASYCQSCHRSFLPEEKRFGLSSRNLVTLLGEALGIHHEDKYSRFRLYGDIKRVIGEVMDYIEASDYSLAEMEEHLPRVLGQGGTR